MLFRVNELHFQFVILDICTLCFKCIFGNSQGNSHLTENPNQDGEVGNANKDQQDQSTAYTR